MARKKTPPGLMLREGQWYFSKKHRLLPKGRVVKSLMTDDVTEAIRRHGAVCTLMDRGDWGAIRRWVQGALDITQILASVREGDYQALKRVKAEATRLEDAVRAWLQKVQATRRAGTVQVYTYSALAIQEHFGPDRALDSVTKREVEAYLHDPKDGGQPWAAATQKSIAGVGSMIWDHEIEHEAELARIQGVLPVLTENPWRKAEIARKPHSRVQYLEPEEWARLVETNRGTPQLTYVACAFLAGLRDREIAYLRRDVDVSIWQVEGGYRGVLKVQSRGGEFPWTVKNPERGERDVPIGDTLCRLILEHIELGFAGETYLFVVAGRDQPFTSKTSRSWCEQAYERAGIDYGRFKGDGLTLHSGRHTYGSWLAQANEHPLKIAMLLGDTVQVVMSTYAHVFPKDLVVSVEVLERKVGGLSGDNILSPALLSQHMSENVPLSEQDSRQ